MKKLIFTIVCAFIGMTSLSAQTVDDLFKEYKDKKGVECIQIPKAMMSMSSGMVKEKDGKDIIKKIDHIRILNIENQPALCREFSEKAIQLKKKGYETMVNSNEDNEKTLILVKTKGDYISEMVILDIEPKECSLIQLRGKFSPTDIKSLDID